MTADISSTEQILRITASAEYCADAEHGPPNPTGRVAFAVCSIVVHLL